MPPQRRRRAVDESEQIDEPSYVGGRSAIESGEEYGTDADEPMDGTQRDGSTEDELVKKMVRYALACEYSRIPIRRDGIKEKVLGSNGRAFKKVFARAQRQLMTVFGMELVEMPTRDRSVMSLEQKRKAGKSQNQAQASSNTYMLVTLLPAAYRVPAIVAPSKAQSQEGEAAYVALCSTLIAIITLSGGELSDARLRRHLQRLVIDKNMPSLNPNDGNHAIENTEMVLQRMVRQGYLVKTSESRMQGDEDTTIWHVGPRGKVEASNEAIASIVRLVYGGSTPELELKLQASLKVAAVGGTAEAAQAVVGGSAGRDGDEGEDGATPGPSSTRRTRRRIANDNDDQVIM